MPKKKQTSDQKPKATPAAAGDGESYDSAGKPLLIMVAVLLLLLLYGYYG